MRGASSFGAAIEVHRIKGPGLIEEIYIINFHELVLRDGIHRMILKDGGSL
jgi:hypothetical protein